MYANRVAKLFLLIRSHTHARTLLWVVFSLPIFPLFLLREKAETLIYNSAFAWHFKSENAFNNLELGQSVHTHTSSNLCTILCATFRLNLKKLRARNYLHVCECIWMCVKMYGVWCAHACIAHFIALNL